MFYNWEELLFVINEKQFMIGRYIGKGIMYSFFMIVIY